MKKKIEVNIVILFVLISIFILPKSSLAKDSGGLGFTVSMVEPKTQIDPQVGYFYVQTEPGVEQTLEVKINSAQEEPVKIKPYVTSATTGEKGVISYVTDKSLLDKTLVNDVMSMVELESDSIELKNYEQKIFKLKVKPPKEHYPGVKLGALIFQLDNGDEKSQVANVYQIQLDLMFSESGEAYNDSQTLKLNDIKPMLVSGRKMVRANLQNPEPKILENMHIEAKLTDLKNGKVVSEQVNENYRMAPNSNFDYGFDLGISDMRAGKYEVLLKIRNDYQSWDFKKEVTITSKQAKEINDESPFKIITPMVIKVATVLNYCLFTILLFVIILRRKKLETQLKIKIKKKIKKRKRKKVLKK